MLILFCSCSNEIGHLPCPNGTFSSTGQDKCTPCPVGYYCPSESTTSPVPCAVGTYANETQSISCGDCPPGYSCKNTSDTPVLCADGTFSPGGRSECQVCPGGYRWDRTFVNQAYMHTYIVTYIQRYIHKYIHTYIQTDR